MFKVDPDGTCKLDRRTLEEGHYLVAIHRFERKSLERLHLRQLAELAAENAENPKDKI